MASRAALSDFSTFEIESILRELMFVAGVATQVYAFKPVCTRAIFVKWLE